jgi:hypothetical protein
MISDILRTTVQAEEKKCCRPDCFGCVIALHAFCACCYACLLLLMTRMMSFDHCDDDNFIRDRTNNKRKSSFARANAAHGLHGTWRDTKSLQEPFVLLVPYCGREMYTFFYNCIPPINRYF